VSGRDYNYEVNCDRCGVLLGMWAYGGPFNGSMQCVDCASTPEDDEAQANSHGAGVES